MTRAEFLRLLVLNSIGDDFENVDQVVRFYGPTTAVVTGRTIISGTTKDGAAVEVDVIFTDAVVKEVGGWKFAAGHVSRVPVRRP